MQDFLFWVIKMIKLTVVRAAQSMSMLILGFYGETEQEGTSRYIKGGLLQALAHQESWGCKSQSVSKGLRTRDFDVPRAGKVDAPTPAKTANCPFSTFCPVGASVGG